MSADAMDPPSGDSSSARTGPSWFDKLLWLGPRVAEARATAFQRGRPGFYLYDVARQFHDEASRIRRAERGVWVVLMLDCIAVEWLVRAHLARVGRGAGTAPLAEDDWTSMQHLPCVEAAWGKFSPAHLPTLMAAVGADRVATLTKLSDEDRESFALRVHELVEDLIEPLDLEAGRLRRALFARWSRMALGAALLALTLGYVGAWVSTKVFPNIAFHRPVSASSLNGYGPDAARLVDGITDEIGFHTNEGEQQWVVIDLGESKKLDKIVVYNRPDCCRERAVPLKVEVSQDNQNFKQIAERTESFDKWTARNLRTEGRYIRLRNTPPNFFHLAEVEIY